MRASARGPWRAAASFTAATVAALVAFPATVAPAQPAEAAAVRATGADGRPCPDVDRAAEPFVKGGCRLRLESAEIDVGSRTVFGRLPFSYDCGLTFDLHVDGRGRTTIDRVLFGGTQGACGDIRPCEADAARSSRYDRRGTPWADHLPWKGRLVPLGKGRFANRAEVCFDTCAGRFDGQLELVLERHAGGWAVSADRAPVGVAGLDIDGEWDVTGTVELDHGGQTAGPRERRAAAAVLALYRAIRAGDARRVCVLLSRPHAISAPDGVQVDSAAGGCVGMFGEILADGHRLGVLDGELAVRVHHVDVLGERAVAQLSAGTGGTPLPLVLQDHAWRPERIDWTPED